MKKRNVIFSLSSVVGALMIFSFQSCGEQGVNFQATATPAIAAQSGTVTPSIPTTTTSACSTDKVSVAGKCVCPAGSNDNGLTCVTCANGQIFDTPSLSCVKPPVVCQAGYTYDGSSCVAISATCNTYIEITDTNFVIPARVVDKVCYYIKLVNATTTRSNVQLEYALSRNHDHVANDPSSPVNRAPSIIGQKSLSFLMQGNREVVLSGDTHGGANISVDNYILIEANYAGLANENLWASGTGDVPPLDANNQPYPIQVHGMPVTNWFPYGSGGIASFQAIDLSPILTVGTQINFIASALDCGGGTDSSDAYLLFR